MCDSQLKMKYFTPFVIYTLSCITIVRLNHRIIPIEYGNIGNIEIEENFVRVQKIKGIVPRKPEKASDYTID